MTSHYKSFWKRFLMAGARKASLDANLAVLDQLETMDELRFEASGWGDRKLAAGDVLFRAGDPADTLYLVASGTVGLSIDGADIATIGRGETIGESSVFLPGETRMGQITAIEPALLYALPRAALQDMRDLNPTQYLRHLDEALHEIAARLRHTLEGLGMDLAIPSGTRPAPSAPLPLSEADQAALAPLFAHGGVDADSLAAIVAAGHGREIPAGTALYLEGTAGESMFAVASGSIALTAGEAAGALFDSASLIGALEFVTPSARCCSAIAETDAVVLELDQSTRGLAEDIRLVVMETVLAALRNQLERANAAAAKPDGTAPDQIVSDLAGWQA